MEPCISTRSVFEAAVWLADGLDVKVGKQDCSPRAVMRTADTPKARALSEDFHAGKVLPIPTKRIVEAYRTITSQCRALQVGRIGGVEG